MPGPVTVEPTLAVAVRRSGTGKSDRGRSRLHETWKAGQTPSRTRSSHCGRLARASGVPLLYRGNVAWGRRIRTARSQCTEVVKSLPVRVSERSQGNYLNFEFTPFAASESRGRNVKFKLNYPSHTARKGQTRRPGLESRMKMQTWNGIRVRFSSFQVELRY